MKRLTFSFAVLIAALGIVACGGGGSTSSTTATRPGPGSGSARLELAEEGCKASEEQAEADPGESLYLDVLERCESEERELRKMVEEGNGSSTEPTGNELPAKTGESAGEDALEAAETYLGYEAFSESGLEEQLEFEGYAAADARHAVSGSGADWNEQAAEAAKGLLEGGALSRSELLERLRLAGFTGSQAEYGVSKASG